MGGSTNAGLQTGADYGSKAYQASGNPYVAAAAAVVGFFDGQHQYKKALKKLEKFNDLVVTATNQALFDLRKQQNIRNDQTATALLSLQSDTAVGSATLRSTYGAAEMLGGSAEALMQVLDYQANEAQARIWDDFDIGVDNYNTTVRQVVQQGKDQLVTSIDGTSRGDTDFGAIVQGAWNMYENNRNRNGAGQSTGTYGQFEPAQGTFSNMNMGNMGGGGFGGMFGGGGGSSGSFSSGNSSNSYGYNITDSYNWG